MRVCVAFTCEHAHVCWQREAHLYSSTGFLFTSENISCRRLQRRPNVTLQLEAIVIDKNGLLIVPSECYSLSIFLLLPRD